MDHISIFTASTNIKII